MESALHIGQVQTEKNICELQSNLPSPSGPPFIFPLWNPWTMVVTSERGKHTQSKLYSYPKEHNSINVSSLLIKFKIYITKVNFILSPQWKLRMKFLLSIWNLWPKIIKEMHESLRPLPWICIPHGCYQLCKYVLYNYCCCCSRWWALVGIRQQHNNMLIASCF